MKPEIQYIFKSKIDLGDKFSWPPFVLTGLVGGAFLLIYLLQIDLGEYQFYLTKKWAWILLILFFAELILIKIGSNSRKLYLYIEEEKIYLSLDIATEKTQTFQVNSFKSWWNYDFSPQNNPNHTSNASGSGSGMEGRGQETPIIMYLELSGAEGELITLYEELLPFQDISDGLEFRNTVGDSNYYYKTFKIKRLTKALSVNLTKD